MPFCSAKRTRTGHSMPPQRSESLGMDVRGENEVRTASTIAQEKIREEQGRVREQGPGPPTSSTPSFLLSLSVPLSRSTCPACSRASDSPRLTRALSRCRRTCGRSGRPRKEPSRAASSPKRTPTRPRSRTVPS
eukprot:2084411-Rhodomonas_salina.1